MKPRLLAGLAALAIAGCNAPTSGEGGSDSNQGKTTESFRVALLTPGSISDAGWNALAYDGLKALEAEMDAQVDNQEAPRERAADAMRSYAQRGYDLILGHGFEYNEVAEQVSKDFPDTVFVSSSGGKTTPNSGAFRFYLEQGFYLAGMLAAEMSKTGVIGSVAVRDYPSIVSTLKAFEAGAKAARPDIKVIAPVYFGTEGDIAGARRAAESVLAQKADFVIHQANAAAQGVFDACKEKGAYALGSNADQNANSSGAVIASAVIVAKPAFLTLAEEVRDGKFQGSIVLKGMDIGAIDFVLNPALESQVPAATKEKLEATKARIKSGEITVPKDEF